MIQTRLGFRPIVLLTVLVAALAGGLLTAAATGTGVELTDVETQTRQFIGYYHSIQLTPEQEAIKKEALSALPAPCCSDNNAYTCCCPCNMSKSTWGLSAYLITEQGADAVEVRKAAQEWIAFINPNGFSGDVCYSRGGCMRAFKDNGCGGMSDQQVVF